VAEVNVKLRNAILIAARENVKT